MNIRCLRPPLFAAALFLGHTALAQQPPADLADDPLPDGAKVRFGVTRPILRNSPGVALLPNAYKNFLAPTMTGGVRRYDLSTGRPLDKKGIVGPGQAVVSADGKRVAVARPGVLTVVEVATGKQILAVQPPDGVIIVGTPGVSLSADGRVLAYGGRGEDGKGAVVVCDVDKDVVLAQLETAQGAPIYPLLSRDGKTLVTHGPPAAAPTVKNPVPGAPPMPKPAADAETLRTAQVWDVTAAKELFKARVTGMGGIVVGSAFSPDADLLALSAGDGPIDLFDVRTGKRVQTLLGRKSQGVRVAISPDGKTVASVGPDYRIQRWSVQGKPLGITDPPPGILIGPITGLLFADNERVIAWLTVAQFAVAWEAPSGLLLSPAMDHAASIRSIALPADKDPCTSGMDGRVFRWDLVTGQLSETIILHPARIPGQPLIRPVVNLSADSTRASWLQRTPTEIFDVGSGEDLYCVPAPSAPPAAVNMMLSPDGLKLIAISRQAEMRQTGSCAVWDLMTQQRVAEVDVPASSNAAAPIGAMSQDGTRLIIATPNRRPTGKDMIVLAGFDLKNNKKLAEVEDPLAGGNVSIVVADDNAAVLTSTLGRVWSIDYVAGRVEKDIDRLPARGENPISGTVVFSPDGKRFAIGVVGEPFTTYGVRVYDWATRKALHTFIGHAGPVTALRFNNDGTLLASGAQDTSVLVWDLSKLK